MLAVAVGLQNAIEGAVMAAPLKRGGLGRGAPARARDRDRLVGAGRRRRRLLPGARTSRARCRSCSPSAPARSSTSTCNEIIPESHSHGNERRATFGLLVGVVGIMVLKVLVGE